MTGKDTNTAMNDQRHEPDRPGARRARSRWWAVGLAGMTGLALTTSLGIGGAPAIGAVDGILTAADDRRGKPDRASTDNKDHKGKGTKDKRKGTPVPCDADALIAAITLANARGGAVLDLATDCTYLLTATIDGAGLPAITTPITLNGGKHTTITRAAAAPLFRILTVEAGGHLTLNHLTITGGQTETFDDGGGILANSGSTLAINHSVIRNNIGNNGGGVANFGTTTVKHSTVSENTARANAGGLQNMAGLLTIERSKITDNTAPGLAIGGGLGSINGATTRINRSSITHNHSGLSGGGIGDFDATTVVTDSTISQNTADVSGGGIFEEGQLTLRRVTITDNNALDGGGGVEIQNVLGGSAATIEDSEITNNTTGRGGGIRNLAATIVLRNTRIAGNQADTGAGVFNNIGSTLTLFSTKVVKNTAVTDGGGIFNEVGGTVELNTATGTVVVKNRPNNCVNVTGCPD
ncbi:right-handed parallel beta-helix repeat-containing protein [Salinispora arenicola]|uniref:right-handed parallel beta-helix repeat-containing protein n=2 Tax=Salinispora arenicola TaxID=168697 RepID=UPI0027DC32AE|nr:right-handed parallel beta-helix repeat-containing protein [Salinispora arenicola]